MKIALYAQNCAPSVDAHAVTCLLTGALKNTMNGIELNADKETQLRVYSEPRRPDENQPLRVQLGFMQSDEFMTTEQVELIKSRLQAVENLGISMHHRFTATGARFHFVEFFVLLPAKTKKVKKGAPTDE